MGDDEIYDSYADEDEIDEFAERERQALPISAEGAIYQYQLTPDLPKETKKQTNPFSMYWGHDKAMGNTKRADNPRHLNQMELHMLYHRNPLLRHRGAEIGMIYTAENCMARSNEDVGGFERRMQTTRTLKEHAKLEESNVSDEKKKKFFDRFRKNKEPQSEQ